MYDVGASEPIDEELFRAMLPHSPDDEMQSAAVPMIAALDGHADELDVPHQALTDAGNDPGDVPDDEALATVQGETATVHIDAATGGWLDVQDDVAAVDGHIGELEVVLAPEGTHPPG